MTTNHDNSQGKIVQQRVISNPSQGQITLVLIPYFVMMIVVLIKHNTPPWVLPVGYLSVAIYLILITYFCIKQKCYKQLFRNFMTIACLLGVLISMSLVDHDYAKRVSDAEGTATENSSTVQK